MDALFPWRRSKKITDMMSLDGYLYSTLKPVLPSAEFVQHLQQRLVAEAYSSGPARRPRALQFVMIIAGMILSMSLVLITGLRIIATLAGMIVRIQSGLRKSRRSSLSGSSMNPLEARP